MVLWADMISFVTLASADCKLHLRLIESVRSVIWNAGALRDDARARKLG